MNEMGNEPMSMLLQMLGKRKPKRRSPVAAAMNEIDGRYGSFPPGMTQGPPAGASVSHGYGRGTYGVETYGA